MSTTPPWVEEPFAAYRRHLDESARNKALADDALEIKPNDTPPYDEWMSQIIICLGHPLARADALDLAHYVGDIDTLNDAMNAHPWISLEPVSFEDARRDVDRFIMEVEAATEPLPRVA